MEIRNYQQAIDYLERFIGKIVFKINKSKKHDPLERMRVLLSLLDNPQDKFKSVLVGGTSGKGSTAYLISHILTTSGYKTGLTVSPHLQKVNERLQVNGKEISDSKFTKLTASMIRIIEQMRKMTVGQPSYFEILVGMAFKHFADQKVDIAVVEVGMGGEFDATNTLDPLVAVLTNVGLDHTSILGKTVEKIARTKAGIIKKNKESRIMNQGENHNSRFMIHDSIVVSGVKQPTVIKIIENRCEKVGAQLNLLWRDFGYKIKEENLYGTYFDFVYPLTILRGRIKQLNDLRISLLGRYQAENASIAIKTVLELREFGFKVAENRIRKALKTAFFPGRFEVVNYTLNAKPYTLVLDGAHNPTKMKEFLKSFKKIFPTQRKVFVIGFKFDKDIKKMLKQIVKVADEIIVTEFSGKTDTAVHASARALNLKSLIFNLKSDIKITVEKDSAKALQKALKSPTTQSPNNPSLIVVTGSLYLVGEIRSSILN